eukprot:jgi/Mesvir1/24730/Mv21995-RA.1
MKALVCRANGDPSVLPPSSEGAPLYLDSSFPLPPDVKANQVRIKVAAASVNFADSLTVQGKYQERPPLPFVPGAEVSGTVVAVGSSVRRVAVGDAVCAVVGRGGYAEFADALEDRVFKLPPGCDVLKAAGLAIAYGTAHLSLFHRAGLKKGQAVLITGAAGGVGLAAVQLARSAGAVVVAVVRGEAKAALMRVSGVDCIIDTAISESASSTTGSGGATAAGAPASTAARGTAADARGDTEGAAASTPTSGGGMQQGPGGKRGAKATPTVKFAEQVKAFLKTRNIPGVDVFLDNVGGDHFSEGLRCLRSGGHLCIVGFAGGSIPNIPANLALVKNLTLHGIFWGSYMDHQPGTLFASMQQVLALLQQGHIDIHVSHQYGLAEAHKAFAALHLRQAIGKVLIVPDRQSSPCAKL